MGTRRLNILYSSVLRLGQRKPAKSLACRQPSMLLQGKGLAAWKTTYTFSEITVRSKLGVTPSTSRSHSMCEIIGYLFSQNWTRHMLRLEDDSRNLETIQSAHANILSTVYGEVREILYLYQGKGGFQFYSCTRKYFPCGHSS